jgi:hypothetical protein
MNVLQRCRSFAAREFHAPTRAEKTQEQIHAQIDPALCAKSQNKFRQAVF